jgi:hypothetical protein
MSVTRHGIAMLAATLAVAIVSGDAACARAKPRAESAAARSGIPPFCVLTGGPRGLGSVPAICRFFDYQQCLQAAADLHGNCVINVDYPGEITSAPGAAWSRPPQR